MTNLLKAVIPAAGMGTRFLPATKAIPKEMLPIVDKPAIQYVVEEAVASGFHDILFVTSQGKSAIADHFDYNFQLDTELKKNGKRDLLNLVTGISEMIAVSSVRQKRPLGLGHAVLAAEPFVGSEPFGVLLGDDIIDNTLPAMQQLANVFDVLPGMIVAVQEVEGENISRYGVVDAEPVAGRFGGRLYKVRGLVEKPKPEEAPSNLAIIGRYILTGDIFDSLRRTQPGADSEIQLTDGIRSLVDRGHDLYAYRFEGVRYDAGDKLQFLIATVEMALKREDLSEPFREFLRGLNLER